MTNLDTYRKRKQMEKLSKLHANKDYSKGCTERFHRALLEWHGDGTIEEAYAAFRYMNRFYI